MYKFVIVLFFGLLSTEYKSQNNILEHREINYYFKQIHQLELDALLKEGVLEDSLTISDHYKDSKSGKLNEDGYMKYYEIKGSIYKDFFKDFLFLQKKEYKNEYYILYFTMAGFDDIQWDLFKMPKNEWNGKERLTKQEIRSNDTIKHLLFNYDEGEKNLENVRIFIQDHYLVMERGNLYHSLYDLKNQLVLVNEESPWHKKKVDEKLNNWIKENLHDKILEIINPK